jgi:hypothetical protein
MSLSSLCALASDLAVLQAIRNLLGLGTPVEDAELQFCAYPNRTLSTPLRRNPACRCEHLCGSWLRLREPLRTHTWQSLLTLAGLKPDEDAPLLELEGHDWVEFGACACPAPLPVRRFVRAGSVSGLLCPVCGTPVKPLEFHTHRALARDHLGAAAEVPFQRLGARSARAATIRARDRLLYVVEKQEVPS